MNTKKFISNLNYKVGGEYMWRSCRKLVFKIYNYISIKIYVVF